MVGVSQIGGRVPQGAGGGGPMPGHQGVHGTGEDVSGLGLHGQPVLLALPALLGGEDLLGRRLRPVPHAEGLAGGLGAAGPAVGARPGPGGPCPVATPLTWKTSLAQVRKDSSCAQSSSPSPMGRMRSPPSSSSRVSTACAKAQKWGYARDPSPKTENLVVWGGTEQGAPSPSPTLPWGPWQ